MISAPACRCYVLHTTVRPRLANGHTTWPASASAWRFGERSPGPSILNPPYRAVHCICPGNEAGSRPLFPSPALLLAVRVIRCISIAGGILSPDTPNTNSDFQETSTRRSTEFRQRDVRMQPAAIATFPDNSIHASAACLHCVSSCLRMRGSVAWTEIGCKHRTSPGLYPVSSPQPGLHPKPGNYRSIEVRPKSRHLLKRETRDTPPCYQSKSSGVCLLQPTRPPEMFLPQ